MVKKPSYSISRSRFAEQFLKLDGNPFSLKNYPFYRQVYDGQNHQLLLMTGRQVAKSTSIGNFMIAEAACRPHWRTLFVSPSQEQTNRFSQTRVGKVMTYSPLIQQYWMDGNASSRVLFRSFRNGAEMTFSYASDDPDRARGVSADRVVYDEVQDIDYDAVIPVINECMSASDYAYEMYCGTPKTMENSIQTLWELSTQTEWVIKCDACGTHQCWRTDKCLGKKGPICTKCGKYVNVRNGQWIDMRRLPEGYDGKLIRGFHIPQFILPANSPASMPQDASSQATAQKKWQRILEKHQTYTTAKFANEVMGVSESLGVRLVSLEELHALCDESYECKEKAPPGLHQYFDHIVAGVDWSGGGGLGTSHTVLWIFGVNPPRGDYEDFQLQTLYFKIYDEGNPYSSGCVDHIMRMCQDFEVELVYGDAGVGAMPNTVLKEMLGQERARQVQLRGGGGAALAFKWSRDRYLADKTQAIDSYMMYLKRGAVGFPNKRQMAVAIDHILAEYEEETKAGNKIWRHSASSPDDALMAQVFAFLAAKTVVGAHGQIGYKGAR